MCFIFTISEIVVCDSFNMKLLVVWQWATHYQTTHFRLFHTERVCRQQFQIWRKWQKVIQTGRKHCGKRRNCSLRAISPFPTVFSKGLFPRGVKRCHCVGMGWVSAGQSLLFMTCGCNFEIRLRRNFFPAYFHLSPLLKHMRKVVGGFWNIFTRGFKPFSQLH